MGNATALLQRLEAYGSPATRSTWLRHGVGENCYGVKFGDLGKLKKEVKTDHTAARDLWASGNHDARVFATMIADPKQATPDLLNAWAADLDNYVIADALATLVLKTPHARALAEAWVQAGEMWRQYCGWLVLSGVADGQEPGLPDDYFARYLEHIERGIPAAPPNRVRYGMNQALIGIGLRNDTLRQHALAVATRLGVVEVDHGQTNCTTPDATATIAKTVAYREQRAAKKA